MLLILTKFIWSSKTLMIFITELLKYSQSVSEVTAELSIWYLCVFWTIDKSKLFSLTQQKWIRWPAMLTYYLTVFISHHFNSADSEMFKESSWTLHKGTGQISNTLVLWVTLTNHLHSYIEIMSSASESISFLLHNLSVMSQFFFSPQ